MKQKKAGLAFEIKNNDLYLHPRLAKSSLKLCENSSATKNKNLRFLMFFASPRNFKKIENFLNFGIGRARYARIAQLVEHDLAKVGAAGSSPVSRSG